MDRQNHQALRAGIAAILFALILRFRGTGLPVKITETLANIPCSEYFSDTETGRYVRVSPYTEVFSPWFAESPPPVIPPATEVPLPSFSDPGEIELYYGSNVDPDLDSLFARPLQWDLRGEEPTVLILSTHSTESYTQAGEPYVETSPWRTLDEHYNMLSIGDRVESVLTEAGIGVVRDREVHDYPSYNGSYVHARKRLAELLEAYPSVRLVLDLHRDAAGDDHRQMRTRATVKGKDSAQLMIVLGTNHDGYEDNLSLGLKLHALLQTQYPGIMRPLQLRAQRFNQDLTPGALLVEVGAAGNTHPEALAAAEALAEAVVALAAGSA